MEVTQYSSELPSLSFHFVASVIVIYMYILVLFLACKFFEGRNSDFNTRSPHWLHSFSIKRLRSLMFSQVYSWPWTLYTHSWKFFKMFFSSGRNKKRDSLPYPFLKEQLSNLSNFCKSRIFRLYLQTRHFISFFFFFTNFLIVWIRNPRKLKRWFVQDHIAGGIGPLFLFYNFYTWTTEDKS